MTPRPALAGWVVLGLLLAVGIEFAVNRGYTARLNFGVFLPILVAIVAHLHGKRVFALLTVLAIPGMIGIGWNLTDRLYLSFEFQQWIFLLAVAAAIACCRPALPAAGAVFNRRFRWARWLMLASLVLMRHPQLSLEFEWWDDAELGLSVPALALLVLLAVSIDWRELAAAFRERVLVPGHGIRNALKTAIWLVLTAAVAVYLSYGLGFGVYGGFGFGDSVGILLALVLILSAARAVDWRAAVLVAIGLVVLADVTEPVYEFVESAINPPAAVAAEAAGGETALERIMVTAQPRRYDNLPRFLSYPAWYGIVSAWCFGLVGAALAPAWRRGDPAALATRRTAVLIVLAVATVFAVTPFGYSGLLEATWSFVLAIAALLMGYRWRYRGLILGPAVLMLGFLACGFALAPSQRALPSGLMLIDLGAIAFPAAFIGLLLSRRRPAGDRGHDPGVGAGS